MRENLEQRAEELAVYIIENRATIRAAAKHFGVSKSTVHKDLSERLREAPRRRPVRPRKAASLTLSAPERRNPAQKITCLFGQNPVY